jgi:hypothetical protein
VRIAWGSVRIAWGSVRIAGGSVRIAGESRGRKALGRYGAAHTGFGAVGVHAGTGPKAWLVPCS